MSATGHLARGGSFGVGRLGVSWGLGGLGTALPLPRELLPLAVLTDVLEGPEAALRALMPGAVLGTFPPRMEGGEVGRPRAEAIEVELIVRGEVVRVCLRPEERPMGAASSVKALKASSKKGDAPKVSRKTYPGGLKTGGEAGSAPKAASQKKAPVASSTPGKKPRKG